MKKKSPTKGLLMFLFITARRNLIGGYLIAVIVGIIFFFTGHPNAYRSFMGMSVTFPPLYLMLAIGDSAKWERYQVSMPIRRRVVVNTFYIGMIITSLLGIPLFALITIISGTLHEGLFEYVASTLITGLSVSYGYALIVAAFYYPLELRKGNGRGEAIATIAVLIAIGISLPFGISRDLMVLAEGISALIFIGIAVVLYFISYFVSQRIYAKLDLTAGGRNT